MALFQQINDDLKSAMKSGAKDRVEVLRFMLSGLHSVQKEKTMKDPSAVLTDEEVISILQKDVKRRKDAVELFRQGKRDDLVAKEEADLTIMGAYLPKELSRDEISKIVVGLKGQGFADFNTLMRETMKQVKGRADGKLVGEVIKSNLG